MDAKEAREKARQLNNIKQRNQYDLIKSKIEEAVNEGKFKAHFYESLFPSVKFHLLQDKYKVEETFHRNEITITISW